MKGQQGNNVFVAPTVTPTSGEGGGGEKKSTINSELWHACAGPLVSLPPVGSLVVYFPQGHSEQVAASMQKDVKAPIPNYPNLPSKLICLLHSVTLHADAETDEVYARMSLQPVNPQQQNTTLLSTDYGLKSNNKPQPEFFCKTLTASDTSTHGGFSVPRRAAEKIFPPLDFSMQPPVQELQARDLHANLWTFRHIYRGQPKRHLLTTGWSLFVSGKRLFAGDSILFIRDENSQLLLGIRRANRQPTNISSSVLSCDSMYIGILAAAAHAAANSTPFTIFYNPRASPSEFVIPLAKYNKAIYSNQLSLGMRFRMMFETEESGTRRYMGTVTGISDLDPVRWKNSQWCNLQVGWDETSVGERRNRVSLWEIEPVSAPFFICPPPIFRSKRPRQPGMPDDEPSDMDNLFKRAMPWLGDEICIKDSQFQNAGGMPGLSLVQWMNMQQNAQNPPVVIKNTQPDYFCPTSVTRGPDLQNQILQQNQFNGDSNNKPPQPPSQQRQQDVLQLNQNLQASTLNQQINQTQNNHHFQSPSLVHHNFQSSQSTALQNQKLQAPLQQQQYILQQKQQQQQKCQIPTQIPPQVNQQFDLPEQHIHFQILQKIQQQQKQQQSLIIQTPPQHRVHENQHKTILENPEVSQHHKIITQQQSSATNVYNVVGSSHISQSTQHPILKSPQLQRNMTEELTGNLIMPPTSGGEQLTTFVNDVLQPETNNGSSNSTTFMHNTDRVKSVASMQILSPGNLKANTTVDEVEKSEKHSKSSSMFIPSEEQIPGTFGTQIDHLESSNSGTSVCLSQTDVQMQHQTCIPMSPFNHSFLFRDTTGLDEIQTGDLRNNVLFGVNIDDSPLCAPDTTDNFLIKGIDSDKDFQNNISIDNLLAEANYNTIKEAQQEISSSIVSQSLGVPDAAAFNSIDSSLNDNCFLNKWSSAPKIQRLRTYTKVYKRGAVGRSIDISRYSGYNELKQDLSRMFSIEGQIEDKQRIGWKLVYVDHENDVLLVGDDPWEEFVICVRCIRILSPQEVEQMSLDGDLGGNACVSNQACSSSGGGNAWCDQQQFDQNSGNLPYAGFYDQL